VKLSLGVLAPGKYLVRILDMTGKIVGSQTLDHRMPNETYAPLRGMKLPSGRYIVNIVSAEHPSLSLQLILE
jgi:hypothetical protein